MLTALLALLPIALLIASLVLLSQARNIREETGLPAGHIVSTDTDGWACCTKPLFAPRYQLAGKPDYLVQSGRHLIPVEIKPNRSATSPYLSDILQLGAYCLLIEEVYHRPPPYGILKYRDYGFEIKYNRRLRQQVLDVLANIRRDRVTSEVKSNHDDPARCARCGVNAACDQRLA
jgi:CRISPR-associated exonuclease Cas4